MIDFNQNGQEQSTETPGDSVAGPPSPRAAGSPWRIVILAASALCLTLLVAYFLLEAFVVRRLPPLTAKSLAAAEALWQRTGPASYDMDLVIEGVRPGPVHVEVRDRQVTKVTRDGRPSPPWTWDTWSIPGQFKFLDQELALAEDPVHEMQADPGTQWRLRCLFDSQFGFLRHYQRTVIGSGPPVAYRVTSFVPR